jgi:cell division protein FtsB
MAGLLRGKNTINKTSSKRVRAKGRKEQQPPAARLEARKDEARRRASKEGKGTKKAAAEDASATSQRGREPARDARAASVRSVSTPAGREKARPRKGKKPERSFGAKGSSGPGPSSRQDASRHPLLDLVTPRTVLLLLLFVIFIALSASPVARNLEATTALKKTQKEFAKERATTRTLEREVEEARSMSYIETEARKQRMVGPDEVLYLVTTDSKKPDVVYRLKALQSMDEAWESIRQALHCGASRQVRKP